MKNTAFSCSVFRLYLFYQHRLEAPPRLELGVELLQSSALPLGYGATVIQYAVLKKDIT